MIITNKVRWLDLYIRLRFYEKKVETIRKQMDELI